MMCRETKEDKKQREMEMEDERQTEDAKERQGDGRQRDTGVKNRQNETGGNAR